MKDCFKILPAYRFPDRAVQQDSLQWEKIGVAALMLLSYAGSSGALFYASHRFFQAKRGFLAFSVAWGALGPGGLALFDARDLVLSLSRPSEGESARVKGIRAWLREEEPYSTTLQKGAVTAIFGPLQALLLPYIFPFACCCCAATASCGVIGFCCLACCGESEEKGGP